MGAFLRRCRGALGISVTWGAVWAAIFAALVLIIGLVDPDSIDPGEGPIRAAGIGGVFGLVSGAVFAALLSLADGRKTTAFPLLTPVDNSMVFIFCPIGAALAAASVAVVKKAELGASPDQPKLPS